ncbi:MAG TPA: GNAT family N-acetyltransferase [Abditibacteriaceae bacterium]|nr:GNAT family N-acetyltransferase [Abditibacteriaceae bacterium]
MVVIRMAQIEDAAQLIEFGKQLAAEPNNNVTFEEGEFNYTVEQEVQLLESCAGSDNSIWLVAEVDAQIVGHLKCTGGTRKATRHSAGIGISVRKDWRGQGVGNQLLAAAIEWAKSTGIITRLDLNVFVRNEAAIHLYNKYGFEVEGRHRRTHCKGGEYIDDLSMALLL